MAFTAVQQPNQKPEESALDKVVKGLQIATSVFNIPVTLSHYKSLNQEMEQKKTAFEQQQADLAKINTPGTKESTLLKAVSAAQIGSVAQTDFGQKNANELTKLQSLVNAPDVSGKQAQDATELFMKHAVTLATKQDSTAAQIIKANLDASAKAKEAELKTKAAEIKNPTAMQSAVAGYGKRIEQAELDFADIAKQGFNRADRSTAVGAKVLPFLSAETQDMRRQSQAERNFINATLRRESGAAIAPSEFKTAEQQYFPRAGDGPGVLAQKERNRAQVLESFRAEAGPAWQRSKLITKENKPAAAVKPHPQDQAAVKPHPQDQAAVKWAKDNPADPRSAAILKLNGA